MWAIVYRGEGEYALEEVATPSPGPGEALVRVDANTICGTDLRIVSGAKRRGVTPPVILGHEVAGTVVDVGPGLQDFTAGDRVGVTPSIPCHGCRACQQGRYNLCPQARILGHDVDGGLAEFLLVPAPIVASGGLVRADAHLAPEEIALAEPLSCVLHAHSLLGTGLGDTVFVIGGGPIGQLHAQTAQLLGARKVILSEPVEFRRSLALRLGADVVVDPTSDNFVASVKDAADGGIQVVVVCAGLAQLVQDALAVADKRARICLFAGFPTGPTAAIEPNLIHYGEVSLIGSSNSTASEYAMALDLIARHRVDVGSIVSHRFPLDSFAQAIETAARPDAMKVAVLPSV